MNEWSPGGTLAVAFLLCLACTSRTATTSEQRSYSPERVSGGPVATRMREIVARPGYVDRGRFLFATCAGCHGSDGEGKLGIGPRLNSETFLQGASDDYLLRTITRGRQGTTMIPWGEQLKDLDVYAIISYLRSLQETEPAVLDESPLDGDVDRGAELFRNICAACHGRSGGGYAESANGTGIGRRAFLAEASNGFLRHVVRNGKTLTGMRPFHGKSPVSVANLTSQQIEDVITYLRLSAW